MKVSVDFDEFPEVRTFLALSTSSRKPQLPRRAEHRGAQQPDRGLTRKQAIKPDETNYHDHAYKRLSCNGGLSTCKSRNEHIFRTAQSRAAY